MNTREYADAEDAVDQRRRALKRADAAAKRGTVAIIKEALRVADAFVRRPNE